MMNPSQAYSDATTFYSESTGSIWSSTDSASFVYTDDPYWAWWGFDGIRGAVTRVDDKSDEPRVRAAAHILRGPFASYKTKKTQHHRRESDNQSVYSTSSGASLLSRRHGQGSRGPSPMPAYQPQEYYPSSPQRQYQRPQQFDNRPYGPPMGMGMNADMGTMNGGMGMGMGMGANMGMGQPPLRPPPPPPAVTGYPPQPGFEAGFIQLGGGGGTQQHYPPNQAWGYNTPPDGETEEIWGSCRS